MVPIGVLLGDRGIAPSVKQAEDCRNEDQGGHSGAQQAANDGAPERRILLAALAKAERHGNHADDHGERRHEHGAKAGEAGFDCGSDGISVVQ